MKNIKTLLRRPALFVAALAIASGWAAQTILGSTVFAAGQVQQRSIQMSDDRASATGVTYKVKFTPATTGAQSLVIDFCSDSSIISGTCTAPSGFNAGSAGLTAGTGTANWTITPGTSTVKLSKGTGSALGTSSIDFELTGITNYDGTPQPTFWARVYTYDCADYGAHVGGGACASTGTAYSSPTAIGSNVDYGGFALSVSTPIQITATVMETLTFCVSHAVPGNGCTATDTPNLVLGHGSPKVLDGTQKDTDTANTQISTNATNGAVVNMKNVSSTSCAGLSRDNGATCAIPGIGGFVPFPGAGTADFGLNVVNGTGTIGGSVADSDYGQTAGSYGMAAATFGTYGDPIFTTNGTVCANVNTPLEFAAQASNTTPAGVYSVKESLIATGTF